VDQVKRITGQRFDFRQPTLVVIGIHRHRKADLFEIADAGYFLRFPFRASQAGISIEARMPMMAMTTNSSIKVNARCRRPAAARGIKEVFIILVL
jgi:hypothetical protein